jgi:antitoxin (DNA-binding transcriptional repressor) of toxin-antitoxin stability system
MNSASISELKSHLSAYLDRVREGEQVVVTDRGRPIAVLSAPTGSLQQAGRTADLIRSGGMRPPLEPLPTSLASIPKRVVDPAGRSLATLLAERREGP